ncbi:hypothetical protein D3C83_200870 [compost metagenome]
MTTTFLPTLARPIDMTIDYENRVASVKVPGVVDGNIGPLRNAVTGDAHRALGGDHRSGP